MSFKTERKAPDADWRESNFQIREGGDYRKGVAIRCANEVCALTEKHKAMGFNVPYPPRFLGIFFPHTRGYVKCPRCGATNRVHVVTASSYTVELLPCIPEDITNF